MNNYIPTDWENLEEMGRSLDTCILPKLRHEVTKPGLRLS